MGKYVFPRTALALLLLLNACNQQAPPLKIGFLGAMSGPRADFGMAGRNGVLLAIEQRNASGGVRGRPLELLVRDDANQVATAEAALRELAEAAVVAVIGPMLSEITAALLPVAQDLGLILLSPTAAATSLAGHDDVLFRLSDTSQSYAQLAAQFLVHYLALRRVATIYDVSNRKYTESFNREFSAAFQALGGTITVAQPFTAQPGMRFAAIAQAVLQSEPQAVVLITSAIDGINLTRQVRRIAPKMQIIVSDWAATEALVALGGRDVEDIYVVQQFQRFDPTARYQEFLHAYEQRFHEAPGFVNMTAYDAANVLLDALQQQAPQQTLKSALLQGSFHGVQHTIQFDRFGDAPGISMIEAIHHGQSVLVYQTQPNAAGN